MNGVPILERRIIFIATAFVLTLFGLAALAINLFQVGLPTCLADIKPFQKGELIAHSPTHYELHYVARMWRFEPEDVVVPAGATVDIYVSTPDVVHGLILFGTDLNLMVVPGVVNFARVHFDKPGVHQLLCHEYCGTGHDRMTTSLRVVDEEAFRAHQAALAAGGDRSQSATPRSEGLHDLPFDRRRGKHRADFEGHLRTQSQAEQRIKRDRG